MSNSIETSGESVEEAVLEALVQLGARKDEVDVEVLATARAGVLGLGAREARVRVTRKSVPAEEEAPEAEGNVAPRSRAISRRRAMSIVGRRSVARRTPSLAPKAKGAAAGARIRGADAAAETATKIRRGRIRRRPLVTTTAARPAARASESRSSGSRRSKSSSRSSSRWAKRTEVRQIEVDAETVELEIKGDGSGILIGRHGQTLDALEYIVNRILARRIKDAAPISLETESYRARRRQQLHRMALSMGEKAKREHKPVRLEPMAPRDRRVVHLALKEDPMITTRSAGEGLMRSIEIMPTDSSGRPENRGGGQNRGRRRDGDRGNPPQPQRGNPERGDPEREREVQRIEPERGNEAIGEQGGFKHGQKRIV